MKEACSARPAKSMLRRERIHAAVRKLPGGRALEQGGAGGPARRRKGGRQKMPMIAMPEDWDRAMVVAGHPDDIEYGIASAVARRTRQGEQVTYLPATPGGAGAPRPRPRPR